MSSSRAGFCGQTSIIFYVLAFLLALLLLSVALSLSGTHDVFSYRGNQPQKEAVREGQEGQGNVV